MMLEEQKDFSIGNKRSTWQQVVPSADHSSADVCVVCALPEEAKAFQRMAEKRYHLLWTGQASRRYHYPYRQATLSNVKGEPLRVHVSWLPRYGPEEMVCHLSHVIEECQPRFVCMIGICAGDKQYVKVGDLIVAERVFSYDRGKVVKNEQGQTQRLHDTITYQIHENTLGFLHFFDDWKGCVADLARPFSEQHQRDWLLERLYMQPTGSLKDIPWAELGEFAPAWRRIVRKLKEGPKAFLSPEGVLCDKAIVEQLYYEPDLFPFRDPEVQCHICPLASSGAVHSDNPFKEVQLPLRGTRALDMEGAAFGRVMEDFPEIEWLIVKGVSDYADQDKDDSHHVYAAEVSATYMLCFIEQYVTQERFPRSHSAHNAGQDEPVQVWNIPYPPNPFFTGRDELLTRVYTALTAGQMTTLSQPQVICGLGGIGKTQIALEYAYQHRQDYQAVLWTLADSRESLVSGFIAIAELLHLPEKNTQDQCAVVKAVQHWLTNHSSWLLILDNADDVTLVQEFLPKVFSGHILLTTRARIMGGLASSIEVDTMPQDVGALFLLRRTSLIPADASLKEARATDLATAREICAELGGLPLALDQVGAYVEETSCSLSDYQSLYRTRKFEMLNKRGGRIAHYPKSVVAIWLLSFKQLEQKHPAAADLLRLCAFLHPDAIPEEILTVGAKHLGPSLQPVALDPLLLNETIAVLVGSCSLIRRDATAKMISMHRLVQAVLRESMDIATQRDWVQRAILAVNDAFAAVESTASQQDERCLPHALACAELTEPGDSMLPEIASLQHRIGWYFYDRGQYSEAESWYLRALAIWQKELGPEHPNMAIGLSNLAVLYRVQKKYPQAESLNRQALKIFLPQWGSNHPHTINCLNNLAALYDVQGKYEQAAYVYWRVLSIKQKQLGAEHPNVASTLNELALLYHRQEKYELAKPLYVRALSIRVRQLGSLHPDTAQSLNNLAALYYAQGKYSEAEPLYRQALSICKQQLGASHPDTAQSLNNLAALYYVQGKYSETEQLYRQALSICEQQLGASHPDTAQSLNNLATLYYTQGKRSKAKPLYQRARTIWEHTLGPQHPHTQAVCANYSLLLQAMG